MPSVSKKFAVTRTPRTMTVPFDPEAVKPAAPNVAMAVIEV